MLRRDMRHRAHSESEYLPKPLLRRSAPASIRTASTDASASIAPPASKPPHFGPWAATWHNQEAWQRTAHQAYPSPSGQRSLPTVCTWTARRSQLVPLGHVLHLRIFMQTHPADHLRTCFSSSSYMIRSDPNEPSDWESRPGAQVPRSPEP